MPSRQRSQTEQTRRKYLAGMGSIGLAGLIAGCTGESRGGTTTPEATETSEQTDSPSATESTDIGFPPEERTEFGTSVDLGDGSVTTFTTTAESGETQYHGLLLDRAALQNLPSADRLESSGNDEFTDKYGPNGESTLIHYEWSLEFFVPFPEGSDTPFTFLGLNWNPNGHPPGGVWTVPHFDMHFHMFSMEAVDSVEGPRAPDYDFPKKYLPEGYARGPKTDERVITDMGEHLAPGGAPELSGGEFTNTLIWGVNDRDRDVEGGTGELSFVEPMISRDYLQNLSETDRRPIRHPQTHRRSGRYPTSYTVRPVPERNAFAVTIEEFEQFDGEV